MKNPLVLAYGRQKRWVNYRLETREGKVTKIPYSPMGGMGSSTDSSTWGTYAEAKKKSQLVGIVLTPDRLLLTVDIDHCLDLKTNKINHEQKDIISRFLTLADTYSEISPSGTGLHVYLSLEEPITLEANKSAPFEIYLVSRYLTVTEKSFGPQKPLRTVSLKEAHELLSIIGYPWKKDTAHSADQSARPRKPLTDDEVLTKAFSAKNSHNIQALYNGSLAGYNEDDSSADMALCNHLAFWSGGDYAQIERLWLASPLAQRTKTQNRGDYRRLTIEEAIGSCTNFYSPPPELSEIEQELNFLGRMVKDKKVITLNTENICRILRRQKQFRYDQFRNVLEYRPEGEAWRAFKDQDAIAIQTEISNTFEYFQRVGKEMVFDAVTQVSYENAYDSASEYIRGLVWDKTPRLSAWLSEVYGCSNDEYHRAIGSNWLKGLVKRILQPGCKFDYVLVLEGPQGSRKSTSLAILGGDWHIETTMNTDNKDFFMQFQGKVIIEFSEGETLNRTETKRMKAIISTQIDTYRPPYGRTMIDYPRRCVFAMTTNQEEYLKDETGNRRWLPVRLVFEEAKTEWLEANREQLYAEAAYRIRVLKEKIYEFPLDEMLKAQTERRVSDPNEGAIVDWYITLTEAEKENGVTLEQVAKEALHMGFAGPLKKIEEISIGNVLRETLSLVKRQVMMNGIRRRRYYPPDPLKGHEVKVVENNDVAF